MNKFHNWLFVGILVIFGGILLVTQQSNLMQNAKVLPSLPPGSEMFKMISPIAKEAMQQQGPQQQQEVQGQSAPPVVEEPKPQFGVEEGLKATYSGTIKTSKGDIEILLSSRDAPRTVRNFVNKSKSGFYKNLTFHRVEDWVVQGGDPEGTGSGGGLMQTELNNLEFVPGSLGIARGADIRVSNDSQFFITKSEAFWLNREYTNFGIVTDGMDVVNKLTKGDKILSITIK